MLSMRAASTSSGGTSWSAARYTTTQKPTPLHSEISTSRYSAWSGSARNPWAEMPSWCSSALATPNSGSRMNENSTPCAVADTTNGMNTSVRYRPMSRIRRFSASASAKPPTRLSGTYSAAYNSVLPTAVRKLGSWARAR